MKDINKDRLWKAIAQLATIAASMAGGYGISTIVPNDPYPEGVRYASVKLDGTSVQCILDTNEEVDKVKSALNVDKCN